MRISALLLAPVALLGLTISAQAADINYNIVGGTLSSGASSGSFSGSFLINSTSEIIDGGSITVIAPTNGTTYSFSSSTPTSSIGGSELFTDAFGDSFRLNLNGALSNLAINTFAVYGAGGDTALITAAGLRFDATGGSVVTPTAAATPEPSSLILLGTGALGAAGSLRRRLRA